MINGIKSIFVVSFLILGCNSNVNLKNISSQEIKNLNMNIYSDKGKKILSIKSPNSVFDKEKNIFNLKETTINIIQDKKIKYIINSDSSKLSNINKILELEGNVKVKTVKQDNDQLYANKFIWNIDKSNYLLIGDVNFENNNIVLSSTKANLGTDNIIEFFNPVKYKIKSNNNEGSNVINAENAFYNIKTKSVTFRSNKKRVKSNIYF